MNYLRGAVSAISAPYQYYKDINPSTLTGAIDVIVIHRPADNGDSELVCSPFHVRFGKWQVLRPSDKQVNVFVNGSRIPFDMKVGEAGEAFFVFETEEDVPADLITSPVLHATVPPPNKTEEELLDAGQIVGEQEKDNVGNEVAQSLSEREPSFLDLNDGLQETQNQDIWTTPKQTHFIPKALRRQDSKATISQSPFVSRGDSDQPPNKTDSEMQRQDQHVDEALFSLAADSELHTPDVEYHRDITLDMEGYKQTDLETSDQVSPSKLQQRFYGDQQYEFTPSSSSLPPPNIPSNTPPSLIPVQSEINSSYAPSPTSSSRSSSRPGSPSQVHSLRATSEPPPEIQIECPSPPLLLISTSQTPIMQEYSWEWGAFPQPSPLKASFGKGRRMEPPKSLRPTDRSRLPLPHSVKLDEWKEDQLHSAHGRSRSVPPDLNGSPTRQKGRIYKEYEDVESEDDLEAEEGMQAGRWERGSLPHVEEFGRTSTYGGTLGTGQDDGSLVLTIDGRRIDFQLSLVSFEEVKDGDDMGQLFNQYLVDFDRLLEDESVVQDPRLVMRWGGHHYIRKKDGSPVMDALVHWRNATLAKRGEDRPQPSPPPADPDVQSSAKEPLTKVNGTAVGGSLTPQIEQPDDVENPPEPAPTKSSSSSWVQWWRSSSRGQSNGNVISGDKSSSSLPLPSLDRPELNKTLGLDARSEPSTPLRRPVNEAFESLTPPKSPPPTKAKKYAKTLRLTSDQLKSLNLKPGANSITFSLSATGESATTARIFVWESTDLVVVSDIDGTITKSDGLGHVFAMIGRDWTHSGVAKLYTDISRNGYKILYLTSRAIGQADATRFYLRGIKQNNYRLPDGPVIMSPDRLMASLHREVIMRKPEVFKMACLRDIQRLFGETVRNPFYGGFGNRITDALSYRSVNVPSARIFTIDHTGEVKMELLELAGYKSSYIHMTDLVDQMFPPINHKWTSEFTDFNYWKTPVQDFILPNLSPPSSPGLTARSDTSPKSTFARLRSFGLTGKQQNAIKVSADGAEPNGYRSSHLRQMSSLERLSSSLGFMSRSSTFNFESHRRSASPSSSSSYLTDEDEDIDAAKRPRGRPRSRSMTSMPGTLDETEFMADEYDGQENNLEKGYRHFEGEDEFDEGYEGEEDEYPLDAEEEAEAAFDDDLLATGEMQKVPFL